MKNLLIAISLFFMSLNFAYAEEWAGVDDEVSQFAGSDFERSGQGGWQNVWTWAGRLADSVTIYDLSKRISSSLPKGQQPQPLLTGAGSTAPSYRITH